MVSLIESGFYDNSKCHRASRQYLICGSSGGREGTNPGWTSPDELPENLPSAGTDDDGLFIFKLVPPKSGRGVTDDIEVGPRVEAKQRDKVAELVDDADRDPEYRRAVANSEAAHRAAAPAL